MSLKAQYSTTTGTPVANGSAPKGRFGTFAGVFTPNILTILGIILFLRTGWVVGEAGLYNAMIIVGIANGISLLTGLSLSAIATSMDVKSGGNYYIISRSLGLEMGGAIGIPLYLSQAISVAFYIIGFTEALLTVELLSAMDPRVVATVVALIFGVVAYVGADFALKIQFGILAILGAALVSFFLGGWGSGSSSLMVSASYSPGVTFWTVFAVFFPAVTGIEVGTSMSGDLKDPGRSIPIGTITSILVTSIIYFAAVFWFSLHGTRQLLLTSNMAMQEIARWPILILLGVWSATLSSALGSVLAAPRTLQAIATDDIVPRWLASQLGSPTEPRMAVLVTTVIAIFIIWIGDLNFVAPIITMFFLNTYGMTNLVAGIERLVKNPSFRPRFRFHWAGSMLGALGCYAAMFLINAPATLLAIVISYGIYFSLKRRVLERAWGDVRSGIWFTLARHALLRLETHRWHAKNWRPNLLVFTGQPHNREQLVEVSEWLSLGQGVVTFFQLLVGDMSMLAGHGLRETARKHIRGYIKNRHMTAFAEAEVVDDFHTGAITVAQAHGIGALEPNTVLLGWSKTAEGCANQLRLMRTLVTLKKSVLFLNYGVQRGFGQKKVINVWWRGRGANADLMLLMAHLICQHPSWKGAKIRLLRVISGAEGREATREHMEQLLKSVRVSAEPVIILRDDLERSVNTVIAKWSREADLTLIGVSFPAENEIERYSERLNELISTMGTVLMVRNAQQEDLLNPNGG